MMTQTEIGVMQSSDAKESGSHRELGGGKEGAFPWAFRSIRALLTP